LRLKQFFLIIAGCVAGFSGYAATLSLQIGDGQGQALEDAVVTLTSESGEPSTARPPPRDHFIDQKDETFIPTVEVMQVGDSVIFRNSDRTRHHVYSFSPLGSFEFVLKPNEVSPPVKLQKVGVIAVGCNIHDFMVNYLFVTDGSWTAKSDAKGVAAIAGLPPGNYIAHFWHPRLRPGAPQPAEKISIAGEQTNATIALPVLPEHHDDADKDHY